MLFLEKQPQLQPFTPRQLVVLSVIAREGEVNQNQIVQQTGIDRSTMADVIHRLSDRNIINRKRSARDARTDAISSSPMGEALLQNNRATFESTEEVLTGILTLESKTELVQVLKNLVNCLDERSVAGIRTRPR